MEAQRPRPVLCLDLDGTLVRTTGAVLRALNREFKTTYLERDVNHYHFDHLAPAHLDFVTECFADPAFYTSLRPYRAALREVQAARALDIEIVIATDRPAVTRDATAEWLYRHGVAYDTLLVGPGTKRALAKAQPLGQPLLVIDDNPAAAGDLRPGVLIRIPRRPWTSAVVPAALLFTSWATISRLLLDLTAVPSLASVSVRPAIG